MRGGTSPPRPTDSRPCNLPCQLFFVQHFDLEAMFLGDGARLLLHDGGGDDRTRLVDQIAGVVDRLDQRQPPLDLAARIPGLLGIKKSDGRSLSCPYPSGG